MAYEQEERLGQEWFWPHLQRSFDRFHNDSETALA